VLNVILQYYQSVCDKAGISLSVDIREDVLSDLSDSDVTVLFGNLLENAYEAAGGQGFIELRVEVNVRSGMTMIEEKNSYLADREKDGDGKLRTNKDKAGHGIGMQSIEKIVRNFDGVYLYDFDNETHIFWSKISLPYQKC
jgi:sensor histidine kinase regulating citrate/malate metabolism